MRRMTWVLMVVGCCVWGRPVAATEHDPVCTGLEPLLTVADFNGDGTVDRHDVRIIRDHLRSTGPGWRHTPAPYLAFFDRNADEALDITDLRLTMMDHGRASSVLDQEIAAAFWATTFLLDINDAMLAGWIPYTQEFAGHGVHWGQTATTGISLTFDPSQPAGANYTAGGELLALFYYHGYHLSSSDPPPAGFTGSEDVWHHHAGACFGGVNFTAPTYDPTALHFMECLTPAECFAATGSTSTPWVPKFHMLHLWLYKLNPCGKFAMTHPDVGGESPELPHSGCDVEDVLP